MRLSDFSFVGRLERCVSLRRNHSLSFQSAVLVHMLSDEKEKRKFYKCDESKGGVRNVEVMH